MYRPVELCWLRDYFLDMVSKNTRIMGVFVIVGIVLWYASTTVTENMAIQGAILLGVGIILPTLINEWRTPTNE